MSPTSAVLLPKVFPPDIVSIGQLLRNPLIPNIDSCCTSIVSEGDLSKAEPEKPYKTIVSVNKKGNFDVGLTRFLGINLSGKSANLLSIDAESMQYTALKNASEAFAKICHETGPKKWIEDMALNKTPFYLVTGLQHLEKAKFKRAILKSSGGGGYVELPLEVTTQIPVHIKGNVSADSLGSSEGTTSGIFGIEVCKVKVRVASPGEPVLGNEVSWAWSYQRVKGTQKEENKELRLELVSEVDVDGLKQLLEQDEADAEEDEE